MRPSGQGRDRPPHAGRQCRGSGCGGAHAEAVLSNRLAQAFIFLCLPAVGLCLYLTTGSPRGAGTGRSRLALPTPARRRQHPDREGRNHLALNPQDGAGWDLLAPIYMRHGRGGRRRRRLRPRDPPARAQPRQEWAATPKALVAQAGGLVTSEAQNALQKGAGRSTPTIRAPHSTSHSAEAGRASTTMRSQPSASSRSAHRPMRPGCLW